MGKITTTAKPIVEIVAIAVAGIWTYQLFVRTETPGLTGLWHCACADNHVCSLIRADIDLRLKRGVPGGGHQEAILSH